MALLLSGTSPSMAFVGFGIMVLLFVGLFFSWFYALGTGLHEKLPLSAPMKLGRFKIALFLPVAYIAVLPIAILGVTSNAAAQETFNPLAFLFIIPLHLLSMACIFYCLYFNAKALKTVELQRPAELSDFLGELFLIWFFPIGIWFIQPRVNAIFRSEHEAIVPLPQG